jgi:hypothetical protein
MSINMVVIEKEMYSDLEYVYDVISQNSGCLHYSAE